MESTKQKPIKAKPHFYACCLHPLQEIARAMGYNLMAHGSMDRDFDLVAVPWIDNPEPRIEVVKAMDRYLRGFCIENAEDFRSYTYGLLPGGRHSYVINLNRGGPFNNYTDEYYYLDISFTPLPL